MSTPRASRAGEAGVTRLDLVLCVGVLGLLALLAGVPGTDGGPDRAVLDAMVVVQSAFERARTLALASQTPHGVAVDPDGERLAILDGNGQLAVDPLGGGEALITLPEDGDVLVDLVSADFGEGGRTAVFDAQGVPLSGGQLVLRAGERTLTLRLDPATGWLDPVP